MKFNLKLNFLVAGLAFVFILIFSIFQNTLLTASIRGVYGFIFFFIIMFPVQWVILSAIPTPKQNIIAEADQTQEETDEAEDGRGQNIDLTTPDEAPGNAEDSKSSGVAGEQDDFQPWDSSSEKKEESDVNPQQIAQAIQHLSDD